MKGMRAWNQEKTPTLSTADTTLLVPRFELKIAVLGAQALANELSGHKLI